MAAKEQKKHKWHDLDQADLKGNKLYDDFVAAARAASAKKKAFQDDCVAKAHKSKKLAADETLRFSYIKGYANPQVAIDKADAPKAEKGGTFKL